MSKGLYLAAGGVLALTFLSGLLVGTQISSIKERQRPETFSEIRARMRSLGEPGAEVNEKDAKWLVKKMAPEIPLPIRWEAVTYANSIAINSQGELYETITEMLKRVACNYSEGGDDDRLVRLTAYDRCKSLGIEGNLDPDCRSDLEKGWRDYDPIKSSSE